MRKLIRNLLTSAAAAAVMGAMATVAPVVTDFDEVAEPIAAGDCAETPGCLDEFTFSAQDPAGGTSSTSLTGGISYRIEIAGSFVPSSNYRHDAECMYPVAGGPGERTDVLDQEGGTPDVYVAGSEVSWTAVDPSPTGCDEVNSLYSYRYTPAGDGPVHLVVNDTVHADNSNDSLYVRIYSNGPTTTTTTTIVPGAVTETAEEIEATAEETLETVEGEIEDRLGEEGVDPDDPVGTIERKHEELEDGGPDTGEIEETIDENAPGDPGEDPLGDLEDEIGDNQPDPDPDLDPDTGPVGDAVADALEEIEGAREGVEEAADDLAADPTGDIEDPTGDIEDEIGDVDDPTGGALDEATGEVEDVTGSELPSETPIFDEPEAPGPEPEPDPDPEPEPDNEPGSPGGESTQGPSGSNAAENEAPTAAGDPSGTRSTETRSPDPTGGPANTALAARASGPGASGGDEGDAGLLPLDFAVGNETADDADETTAPRIPTGTHDAPSPTSPVVLGVVALTLLAGTSEMARRAWKRLRSERTYASYRYR